MGWLSGWSYRKSVTLSRASGAVTNYQMKVIVGESAGSSGYDVHCGGNALSSFNDIRFTKSDGTTLLDYWIESLSGTTPNQAATVWVEFDSIGTGATTFYMYYGNGSASAVSSGDNTFLFFDDFLGSSIDTNKWEGDTGSTSQSNSIMTLVGEADVWKALSTKVGWDYGYKLATKAKFYSKTTSKGAMINFRDWETNQPYVDIICYDTSELIRHEGASNYRTISVTINEGSYYIYQIQRETASKDLFYEGTTKLGEITNGDTLGAVPIGFRSVGGSAYQLSVDWVYVAQYLATEPAWGTWGASETVNWLSGWSHRKQVALSRASGAVTNYQMKVLLGESGRVASSTFWQEWATQPYATTNQTTVNSSGGTLNVTSTGDDPYISMYSIGSFDPSIYKYIAIRYRVVSGTAGNVDIFFTNSRRSIANSDQDVTASLISDGAWHVLYIDMSAHQYWANSAVTGWRYDWASANAVNMEIDYIGLCALVPVCCDGLCLSSFNDIRFTKSDGTTLLDYWIESISGTTPNQFATIWVEFDSIGTTDTLFYMYYGNAGASAASSCISTFRYSDDGVSNNVTRNVAGSSAIADSGGQIAITGGNSTDDAWVFGALIGTAGFAAECKSEGGGSSGSGDSFNVLALVDSSAVPSPASNTVNNAMNRFLVCRVGATGTDANKVYIYYITTAGANKFWNGTVWGDSATNFTVGTGRIVVKLWDDGTNFIANVFDSSGVSLITNPASIAKSSVKAFSSGVCLVSSEPHNNYYYVNTVLDDWLVRQYLATEPAWGSWGLQEDTVTAVVTVDFPDATLDSSGTLSSGSAGSGSVDFPAATLDSLAGAQATVNFPDATLAITGLTGVVGSGAVVFPDADLASIGLVGALGQGAIDFPDADLAARDANPIGQGAVDFPDADLLGASGAQCAVDVPDAALASTGLAGVLGQGDVAFPDAVLYGLAGGNGTLALPDASLAGTGTVAAPSTGDGVVTFPVAVIDATSTASYELFEHHDFNDDTLNAQPIGTTRYENPSSWLVKAQGAGGDILANAVVVDEASGVSYLLFDHQGSGSDLHAYPDKIVVCLKFDTTKTGTFVVGFSFDPDNPDMFGICFTPKPNPTYGQWFVGQLSADEIMVQSSPQNKIFDPTKWCIVEVWLGDSGYTVYGKLYPIGDPSSAVTISKHFSGFNVYENYTGDPHTCLAHLGQMKAWCCWEYMSTYADPGSAAIPDAPPDLTPVTGDGAVAWGENFTVYAGNVPSIGAGVLDFPDFFISESLIGHGHVWIDEGDWAVYVGQGGLNEAIDFPEPFVYSHGAQDLNPVVDIDFPEAEVESFGGALASIVFADAEVESSAEQSILGSMSLRFPSAIISASGFQGNINRCHQEVAFPDFTILATGRRLNSGDAASGFPEFLLKADNLLSVHGRTEVDSPSLVLAGTGHDVSEGSGNVPFPEFLIDATADDPCEWNVLRYSRDASGG